MFNVPLIIITSLMAILNVIAITYTVITHYKDKRSLQEQSNLLYTLMKKLSSSSLDITEIKESYSALSSSIDLYNETQSAQMNTFPSPQLVKLIELSIKDYIEIEMTLSSDMRVVKSESVRKVMEMLVQTYPTINKKYLIKKCSAYIKNMFESPEIENNENQ